MTEHFFDGIHRQGQPDRFDKFIKRAGKVLNFAEEEAARRSSPYLDTEHLLLGISRDRDCLGVIVLTNLGVDLEQLRKIVEESMANRESSSEVGLTAAAKKVIEFSIDEARGLNHHYLGTEHIVLGLIREGDGIAARTLLGLGIDLDRTRVEIEKHNTPPENT